ncbi:immunoglobulin superfamily member 11 [Osmerus mordax]|uniref:immunoglobulin superfamily member 11 n=1 Tax=Osmerus mordax TaxID=8014 RepID=UPI00350FF2B4
MLKFHNSDLWIAWLVIFCMEGTRFDLHTGSVSVRALDVTVSQSSIQVARGQAAILPCSFTTSAALNNLNIIWMVIPLSNANQPEQMQGTVTLRNISTSTSGLYQCISSNAIGKSTCLLNLQVVAPQPQSVGLIAGTIATGILAVIICSLLVVVTLFYWKNKNKYEEEEIPNEIREDDLPPKRSSSAKAFHADASSSENDTLTSTNTYNSRYWHNPKPNYDTNSYTRYNGDTRQTFSTGHPPATTAAPGSAPGSAPLARQAYSNGSHTLPPPKTLVVTTNSAPSPPTMVRSNGSVSLKPVTMGSHGQHTHSYAVSQATLERMGAVPVMVPAQSRAGSLV